jgi:hypothetical protein
MPAQQNCGKNYPMTHPCTVDPLSQSFPSANYTYRGLVCAYIIKRWCHSMPVPINSELTVESAPADSQTRTLTSSTRRGKTLDPDPPL